MTQNISGKYRKKIEKSKKEDQEYGRGKKNIIMCKNCDAVYYYKSWKHSLKNFKHINEDKPINFKTCPACQMERDNKYEGRIIFENVPEKYMKEVVSNIENTGKRAYERDPMDRVIKVKKRGHTIEVFTTENQLARNIARQIERAYKNAKADISWSKEESVVNIKVKFS